jgi:hypothetical protein
MSPTPPACDTFTEAPQDAVDGTGAWEWDIHYTTHALLSRGILAASVSRVVVLAPDWHTSWKRACWMVQQRAGWYITRTDCVGWPEEGT